MKNKLPLGITLIDLLLLLIIAIISVKYCIEQNSHQVIIDQLQNMANNMQYIADQFREANLQVKIK